jgi:hypothetical protein
VLTKNEGLPLALGALAAACLRPLLVAVRRILGRTRLPVASLAPVVVAASFVGASVLLLSSWRSGIPNRPEEDYVAAMSLTSLLSGLRTTGPTILRSLTIQMTSEAWASWGAFWWILPVVLLAGWRGLRSSTAQAVWLALAGALAVYFSAYLLSGGSAGELVQVTWHRFLVQMSLPILMLFALATRECLRSRNGLVPPSPGSSSG